MKETGEVFKPKSHRSEIQIQLGQRAAIVLVDKDGNDLGGGFVVEVKTTEKGNLQVFAHSRELCNRPGGCQPFIEADINEAKKERLVKEELEMADFLADLAELFGGNVFTVDETGVHPLGSKFEPKPKAKE